MAKVSMLDLPAEWLPLIEKIFRWYDNQMYPCWGMRWIGGSRAAKARSRGNSITSQVAAAWDAIADKTGWEAAAAVYGMAAYKLFTKDQSYRIKNSLAGSATPSTLHQYTVRKITINDNNTDELVCIFRRRNISNLPVTCSASVKIVKTSAAGNLTVMCGVLNKQRGANWPTNQTFIRTGGNLDWTAYSKTFMSYLSDRVGSAYIAVVPEGGWEGEIYLDNTRIFDHNVDRYVGWRQNPGTDDWHEEASNITIQQEIAYES
jgi:hypothetical protein